MVAKTFRLSAAGLAAAMVVTTIWVAPAHASPPSAQAAVAVTADTYVVREVPNWAYGSAMKLAASNWSTPWYGLIYLKFQIPAPPAGKRVTSARLELTFSKLINQPSIVELRSVASTSWPESITYNTRPAVGAVVSTASVPGQGTPSLAFDITAQAGSPGAKSFAITNPTAQSAAVFHSREQGADGPRLVITYSGTLCGASFAREGGQTWQEALAREDALFNGLEAVRFFHGGLPPAWPGPLEVGTRALVVSFKGNPRDHLAGTHDAYMRQWFAGAPRDRDIYWIYFHEPEDNIRDGQFSAADYRAALRHLAALADEAGNPRLHATQVLMQWTVVPASGRDWRDYYPGDSVLDVLAWDIYNFTPSAQRGEYEDPAELIDPVAVVNNSVGLPIGVAEMGSHIAVGDDGTRRADWLRGMIDYLAAHGSLWNLYFDLDWPTGDYRLRDPAGSAVWREFCS